ncbi:ABC transporter permease [Nocardioides stalactiti]|uniref:ABC transporter permease n=1 Tax=Nocardioides stalactiti TaxID=2755356 RepID=UPI001603B1FB|nr:ABC transporter permease [Nocardioides stalactiti]
MSAEAKVADAEVRTVPVVARVVPVIARWVGALSVALVLFSVLLLLKGANPITAYTGIWETTFLRSRPLQEIFVQMTPLVLGALAVAVPARAGLTNVGGEGQIIMGGVGACGASLFLGDTASGGVILGAMIVCAMLAGALWAGLAAAMRLVAGVNEAISTLLLNFVALDLLLFLIYQPWRESPTGQPATKELVDVAKLPVISGTQVNMGLVLAIGLAVVVFVVLTRTKWGFKISVAGGNAEAARRSGLNVPVLILSALLIGGALAGLAGMIQFAGVEYKLRASFGYQLGYTSFLACWLARHQPFPILVAAFVFAALSVSSDSLQLDAGVPAASIHVLTALILIAVLGFTAQRKKATA